MAWIAVVPVKRLSLAKTRLHLAGVGRDDLAMAFALDTVTALRNATAIDRVVVVTDDRRARRTFDDVFGIVDHEDPQPPAATPIHVVPDVPDAGLNTALSHGAQVARLLETNAGIVAVSSDLPAVSAAEVDHVLASAPPDVCSFVADASGIGTTVLCAPPGVDFAPDFGRRSRAAHRRMGFVELTLDVPTLRRDVDTAVDLWDAQRLGTGPATRGLLATDPVGQEA
jgi:2-phospho-L-lactate guanylyltransferase